MAKKTAYTTKIMGIWIIILSIFFTELFFYTWSRVQCIRLGYEISKEKDKCQYLTTLENKLKVEIAWLKSPKRIAKIVKDRFGLIMPAPKQILIVP